MISEINVNQLAAKQEAGETIFLLDVREPHEAKLCHINGSILIPMGQVENRLAEIPRDMPIIVYCHLGGRSGRITQYLKSQGFNDVANLTGGIDQWAVQIDPNIERY